MLLFCFLEGLQKSSCHRHTLGGTEIKEGAKRVLVCHWGKWGGWSLLLAGLGSLLPRQLCWQTLPWMFSVDNERNRRASVLLLASPLHRKMGGLEPGKFACFFLREPTGLPELRAEMLEKHRSMGNYQSSFMHCVTFSFFLGKWAY